MTETRPERRCFLILRSIWTVLLFAQIIVFGAVIILAAPRQGTAVQVESTGLVVASVLALATTLLVGGWLRGEIYKRGWIADAIAPGAYLAGNVPLLVGLAACSLTVASAILMRAADMSTLWVAGIGLLAYVVNFPTGAPLVPLPPPFAAKSS